MHQVPRSANSRAEDSATGTSGPCKVFEYVSQGQLDFGEHHHRDHQLIWMREGRMRVAVGASSWHLNSDHMVWLPGSVIHQVTLLTPGSMVSMYTAPEFVPTFERWRRPQPVRSSPLAEQLLLHLCADDISPRRRRACHDLLLDVIADSPAGAPEALPLPQHPKVRAIAQELVSNPGDPRTLSEWSTGVGVSEKTVVRIFRSETSLTFGRWRTRARLIAAAEHLAQGASVKDTARIVGYHTSSGFIAAFAAEYGITPSSYAASGDASQSPLISVET